MGRTFEEKSMAVVGDRIAVASKGSQRLGVVTAVSGSMVAVTWDAGGESRIIPGPGVLQVLASSKGKKAAAKKTPAKKKAAVKKTSAKRPTAKKPAAKKKAAAPAKRAPVKKKAPAKKAPVKKATKKAAKKKR